MFDDLQIYRRDSCKICDPVVSRGSNHLIRADLFLKIHRTFQPEVCKNHPKAKDMKQRKPYTYLLSIDIFSGFRHCFCADHETILVKKYCFGKRCCTGCKNNNCISGRILRPFRDLINLCFVFRRFPDSIQKRNMAGRDIHHFIVCQFQFLTHLLNSAFHLNGGQGCAVTQISDICHDKEIPDIRIGHAVVPENSNSAGPNDSKHGNEPVRAVKGPDPHVISRLNSPIDQI